MLSFSEQSKSNHDAELQPLASITEGSTYVPFEPPLPPPASSGTTRQLPLNTNQEGDYVWMGGPTGKPTANLEDDVDDMDDVRGAYYEEVSVGSEPPLNQVPPQLWEQTSWSPARVPSNPEQSVDYLDYRLFPTYFSFHEILRIWVFYLVQLFAIAGLEIGLHHVSINLYCALYSVSVLMTLVVCLLAALVYGRRAERIREKLPVKPKQYELISNTRVVSWVLSGLTLAGVALVVIFLPRRPMFWACSLGESGTSSTGRWGLGCSVSLASISTSFGRLLQSFMRCFWLSTQ